MKFYHLPLLIYSFIRVRFFLKFKNLEQLRSYQLKKIDRFLQGKKLSDYPIQSKNDYLTHFEQHNTLKLNKETAYQFAREAEQTRNFKKTFKNYTIGMSSGTSGTYGIFMVSPRELAIYAGSILAKALPKPFFQKHRIAFFFRANSNLYTTAGGLFFKFNFYDMLKPINSHYDSLKELNPTMLIAPASVLKTLALAQQGGKLNIDPQVIYSVAEVLEPENQVFIESVFKKQVKQIYQATEGFLGISCSAGSMHLNEDLLYIEKDYLDEKTGRFQPVITDFSRITQKIIRYRLNDILIENKTPCACGQALTRLDAIEGRSDDIFYFKSATKSELIPVYADFIRRAIILVPEVMEYKVIQNAPEKMNIQIQSSTTEMIQVQAQISASFEELCELLDCRPPEIYFSDYEQPPAGKKLRRIQRAFSL